MEQQKQQPQQVHYAPETKDDEKNETARKSSKSSQRKETDRWRVKNPKPPRHNKLYRTPITPEPQELLIKETTFVLDCCAVASISQDYSDANPKLGSVIPTYNAQLDKSVKKYFDCKEVKRTIKETNQYYPGTSIEGRAMDDFMRSGAGYRYLMRRNVSAGNGLSQEQYSGHRQWPIRRMLHSNELMVSPSDDDDDARRTLKEVIKSTERIIQLPKPIIIEKPNQTPRDKEKAEKNKKSPRKELPSIWYEYMVPLSPTYRKKKTVTVA